jgi:hypothetical protein
MHGAIFVVKGPQVSLEAQIVANRDPSSHEETPSLAHRPQEPRPRKAPIADPRGGVDGHHERHSDSLGIRFEIVLPLRA